MQWVGSSPVLNEEYDIEMEIPNALRWNKEIDKTLLTESKIFEKENITYLIGRIGEIGEDNVAILHLGNDHVIIEILDLPTDYSGWILIKAVLLRVFDVNI